MISKNKMDLFFIKKPDVDVKSVESKETTELDSLSVSSSVEVAPTVVPLNQYLNGIKSRQQAYDLGYLLYFFVDCNNAQEGVYKIDKRTSYFNKLFEVHANSQEIDSEFIDKLEHIKVDNYVHDFVRGYFECCGSILFKDKLCVYFPVNPSSMLTELIPKSFIVEDNIPVYKGDNALEFLSGIYDYSTPEIRQENMYDVYARFANFHDETKVPVLRYKKLHPDAKISKKRASDEGYDVTLVKVDKKMSECSVRFDTGLQFEIPHGYYLEVVPRSSLFKETGAILANNVGIIDRPYRGNLLVQLTQVDENVVDFSLEQLKLPFVAVQVLLKKSHHFTLEAVEEFDNKTNRGAGGFGSTNK